MYISHHEQQLGELLQQQMENRKSGETNSSNINIKERDEKFRLEVLKQKDKTCESAIASPEVKHSNIYMDKQVKYFDKNISGWIFTRNRQFKNTFRDK